MKINFTFDTEYGVFSDAITLEDTHTHTAEEIEAMKQERFTNWINSVKAVEDLEQPLDENLLEENIE